MVGYTPPGALRERVWEGVRKCLPEHVWRYPGIGQFLGMQEFVTFEDTSKVLKLGYPGTPQS
jgi:hypothetical protein